MRNLKYVFVCGMPRSGTTILAKEICRFDNCTAFENTGVIMDEGQYLQDVYPTEWACGGAGRFGYDPRAHLTENSTLLTPANVSRILKGWEPHWDGSKAIRVEKTPGNLLKTRFLQAAFPNAYFVVIKRHPVAVSLATQKWSRTPLHDLFKHWLRCQEIFDEDKKHLACLYELRYEDYTKSPKRYLEEIANFIGTKFSGSLQAQTEESFNKKYFDRWAQTLERSRLKSYYRHVAAEYESQFRNHGYSSETPSYRAAASLAEAGSIRRAMGTLLHLGADISSVFWQADLWFGVRIHQVLDDYCPARIRPFLHRRRPAARNGSTQSIST